jgi:3-hydroxyisobutyrate dehydrogenase-like beta-hydroxyacid dehydrogenase
MRRTSRYATALLPGKIAGMAVVGIVGLGAMGSRVARRLLGAGHSLVVWNRTPAPAEELGQLGAAVAESPAEVARRVEVLLTMVRDPRALQQVTEPPAGIAAATRPPLAVIELSTVGPAAVARLRAALPGGVELLDAPVLGSLAEVESGTLQLFVGGEPAAAERWLPLLEVLGTPLYVGPLGSGAAAKLVANLTLIGTIGLFGEAVALGRSLGLPDDKVFQVLAKTSLAGQVDRRRASIESGDYPPRFKLSLARKDADLVLDAGAGIALRLTEAARSWLADADAAGLGEADYSAVLARILGE